jgi:uncharacterized protein YjbK
MNCYLDISSFQVPSQNVRLRIRISNGKVIKKLTMQLQIQTKIMPSRNLQNTLLM